MPQAIPESFFIPDGKFRPIDGTELSIAMSHNKRTICLRDRSGNQFTVPLDAWQDFVAGAFSGHFDNLIATD